MARSIQQSDEYLRNGRCRWSVWLDGAPEEPDSVDHVIYILDPAFHKPVRRILRGCSTPSPWIGAVRKRRCSALPGRYAHARLRSWLLAAGCLPEGANADQVSEASVKLRSIPLDLLRRPVGFFAIFVNRLGPRHRREAARRQEPGRSLSRPARSLPACRPSRPRTGFGRITRPAFIPAANIFRGLHRPAEVE